MLLAYFDRIEFPSPFSVFQTREVVRLNRSRIDINHAPGKLPECSAEVSR
jgi:hypothetical protein